MTTLTITAGRPYRLTDSVIRDQFGFPVDLSTVTTFEVEVIGGSGKGSTFYALELGSGVTIQSSTLISATAITDPFTASGSVGAAGAGFVYGEADGEGQVVDGVYTKTPIDVAKPGDLAVIVGSASNDGSYRVVDPTSADAIELDTTFSAEPAAGTIEIRRPRFQLDMSAIQTALLEDQTQVLLCFYVTDGADLDIKATQLATVVTC